MVAIVGGEARVPPFGPAGPTQELLFPCMADGDPGWRRNFHTVSPHVRPGGWRAISCNIRSSYLDVQLVSVVRSRDHTQAECRCCVTSAMAQWIVANVGFSTLLPPVDCQLVVIRIAERTWNACCRLMANCRLRRSCLWMWCSSPVARKPVGAPSTALERAGCLAGVVVGGCRVGSGGACKWLRAAKLCGVAGGGCEHQPSNRETPDNRRDDEPARRSGEERRRRSAA